MLLKLKEKSRTIRSITSSKRFSKYFSNTSWMLIDQVFNLAIAFIISIFVARYLGPDGYGLLNFSKSIGRLLLILCGLGLESIVIKRLVNEGHHEKVLGSALFLQVSLSSLLTVLFIVWGNHLVDDKITFYLLLINFIAVIFQSFVIVNYYFQSQVKARFIAKVAVIKILISSSFKIYFILFEYSIIYFGLTIIIEAIVGACGAVIVLNQKSKQKLMNWRVNKDYAISLLKDSWPLVFSSFVVFLYNKTDIIMIKYMLGNAQAGYYAVAFSFTSLWFFISSIISKSLFPAILNAKKIDIKLYQYRVFQLLRFMVFIGILIGIFVTFISSIVIENFYGEDYLPAIEVIRIQIWAIIFVFIGSVGGQWYVAENLQVLSLTRTAIGAIVNIALNLFLIPRIGVIGAAYATVAAQLFASFLGNAISPKTRPLFLMQLKALGLFIK